ncbi:sugar nucleotide-binding protein [Candidatus Roizmanbacteria bacterium]|nr:sugar nucleotide-binding protein [Candidatus Roizmanbacteria bacterium]
MKILILGASSYLGARIFFDLKDAHEVIGTYSTFQLSRSFTKLDVTKKDDVTKLITAFKPQIIIHVANIADPRWCATHPPEALLLNQIATEFIASSAIKFNSKIIYLSSIVAYEPATLYSQTKVESEKIIASSTDNYIHLRPAFVLGYSPNTTNDRPFNR